MPVDAWDLNYYETQLVHRACLRHACCCGTAERGRTPAQQIAGLHSAATPRNAAASHRAGTKNVRVWSLSFECAQGASPQKGRPEARKTAKINLVAVAFSPAMFQRSCWVPSMTLNCSHERCFPRQYGRCRLHVGLRSSDGDCSPLHSA